ncbi:DNA mismatch repair endonuclease MutL [Tenacibaculum finnmarkense]|uniref:DNA mismatch repair protein MutL n=1 Tax=Tenacibaculum finnmarkense genomovar ulcerans TaxID=2781388 RepID=A0A2I2MAJ3_9FLAO|nr:DNA mismatch repair endonuclease MutL [Tenacibaculum finnmarkense]MBE7634514.1 DNA mismatch repair endonuclease MutL [Tenacibaculum finnmarkense genomovar ulcerans]MBE7646163.1 DNA mismatch repair endonuclease MutL [Tenacibaculum finnmarkense genomovar ulcerans]MBE7648393.1 DNA mismatch repair endonuclease MutL [Tenacibaculum finnmarkense genomovar ulcerans]MBE7698389.1 DNA mismatch repair endonuclease MutL [Tenacibaculum finnmarkense genomovar ulcerans]MCD8400828.1 DNA mismatch repair endo
MSDIIQLLPDHVANQIAAGEVVQRPASVVKELVENSIDAGAATIKLLIKDAGKTLIQVIDDGKGMSIADARLSFERHATSKIKDAQDLFNLNTKGFRGEALASIAAIAHVELKTRQENQELGSFIKIAGSKIISEEAISTPKGTSIAVKNLFYNIPARRNFLKSDSIETRHIVDEFQRVALAHPDISFLLQHNNTELYHLKKSNLRKRIVAVFGNKMNERLVPISEQTDLISIRGFTTKSEFAKKKRGEQYFFVNNRFIKSSYLNHAVVMAFEGLLENGSHPSYFLYLEVPPNSIDINIHPTKTEIKFDNEKILYAILRATVKHSLGQYNVTPALDFSRDANLDTPYDYSKKSSDPSKLPPITVDHTFNPFTASPSYQEKTTTAEYLNEPNNTNKQTNTDSSKSVSYQSNFKKDTDDWEALYSNNKSIDATTQEQLFESQQETETGKTFQIQKKYLLSSIKSGVVLINQSLAHQRILYEEFLENITIKEASSQQLLFPVTISFSKSDIEMIYTIKSDLESAGFMFDEFTKESVIIRGIPTSISESQITLILEELLDDIKLEVPDASFSHFDVMAKSFAKSLALKTGTVLSIKEQENLVNNLFSCREPNTSPFGKPTFKTLTLNEIDTIFNK